MAKKIGEYLEQVDRIKHEAYLEGENVKNLLIKLNNAIDDLLKVNFESNVQGIVSREELENFQKKFEGPQAQKYLHKVMKGYEKAGE